MDISQNTKQIVRMLRLGAFLGSLLCLPAGVFAGDLSLPHLASSETDGLSLTPPQKQRLTALESASHDQAHQLIGQIEKLRFRLSEAYEEYAIDLAAVRRTNQDLNRIQGQLLDLRLSEQVQLRRILSADQFNQLQAAIRKRGPDEDRPQDSADRHGLPNGEKAKP